MLTRSIGEVVLIAPQNGELARLTVGELFADGPIVVSVSGIRGRQVKIAIEAPAALKILRGELVE